MIVIVIVLASDPVARRVLAAPLARRDPHVVAEGQVPHAPLGAGLHRARVQGLRELRVQRRRAHQRREEQRGRPELLRIALHGACQRRAPPRPGAPAPEGGARRGCRPESLSPSELFFLRERHTMRRASV